MLSAHIVCLPACVYPCRHLSSDCLYNTYCCLHTSFVRLHMPCTCLHAVRDCLHFYRVLAHKLSEYMCSWCMHTRWVTASAQGTCTHVRGLHLCRVHAHTLCDCSYFKCLHMSHVLSGVMSAYASGLWQTRAGCLQAEQSYISFHISTFLLSHYRLPPNAA